MVLTRITPRHTVSIPNEFQKAIPAGQEVAISLDKQGRLVITPVKKINAALMSSFGMWSDRTDIPADSVKYVRQIRKGKRLNDLKARTR